MDSTMPRLAIFFSTFFALFKGSHGITCTDRYTARICLNYCCGSYSTGKYCCTSVYTVTVSAVQWYYIVGGVVGGLAVLGAAGTAVYYLYWRPKHRPRMVVGPATSNGITVVSTTSHATRPTVYVPPPAYGTQGVSPGGPPGTPHPQPIASQPVDPAYPPGAMGSYPPPPSSQGLYGGPSAGPVNPAGYAPPSNLPEKGYGYGTGQGY